MSGRKLATETNVRGCLRESDGAVATLICERGGEEFGKGGGGDVLRRARSCAQIVPNGSDRTIPNVTESNANTAKALQRSINNEGLGMTVEGHSA